MKRRVNFVTLIPVETNWGWGMNAAGNTKATMLYALGDDGRVYLWTGAEWKLTAEPPMVEACE
jgi:hypothetical protein